jgi:hypothetical protein
MLRIYQLHNKRNITLLFLGLLAFASYAQVEKKDTLLIQYKIGFNGILDKSIVTRLLLTTQNSFVFRNRWTSFEPILNYRFGHVQPNGRAKTDLENDY